MPDTDMIQSVHIKYKLMTVDIKQAMKRIRQTAICLLGILLFISCNSAQKIKQNTMSKNSYADQWKEIDKQLQNGRFEDAYKLADSLNAIAVRDKNDEQIIKSWIKRFAIQYNREEDPILNHLNYIEANEDKLSTATGRSIATSYKANIAEQYLNNHRYKLRALTTLSGKRPEDKQLWTIKNWTNYIAELYLESLKNQESKSIPISKFGALVEVFDANASSVRNHIYDLLAYQAISYFNKPLSTTTEGMATYIFDQNEAFQASDVFRNYSFNKGPADNRIAEIIRIYQQLEQHYASNKAILWDIIRHRLRFAYDNSTVDDKNTKYDQALTKLFEQYKNEEHSYQILKQLIQFKRNLDRSNPKYKDVNKNCVQLLSDNLNHYTDPIIQKEIQFHIDQFKQRNLQFQSEQVYTIGENFPILISYKNISKLDYKIFKLDISDLKEIYTDRDKLGSIIESKKITREGSIDLPNPTDYNQHTAEYVVDGLEQGAYIIVLITEDEKYSAYQLVHISNIAYATGQHNDFVFADRQTGQPIAVTTEAYEFYYKRRREIRHIGNFKSNERGILPNKELKNRGFSLLIRHQDDFLFLNENHYRNEPYQQPQRAEIYCFTDRAIYRPGQKVYYKAILLDGAKYDPKVLSNTALEIKLMDQNYQVVEQTKATTNAYGSVHGHFNITKDRLNGRYQILTKIVNQNVQHQEEIRVESYKRPSFEISFDKKVKGAKLNTQVQLSGKASHYTGSSVDGAKVRYTVHRRSMYRPYYYYRYYNPTPDKLIHIGTTETDASGAFKIDFFAETPPSSNKDQGPFMYEIEVLVTDDAGETQTEIHFITLGKYAYNINVAHEVEFSKNAKKILPISLNAYAGDTVQADVDIKIESLKPLAKMFKKKFWNTPEYQLISQQAYYKKTNHYAYKEEDKYPNREIDRVISSETINIDQNYELDLSNLAPGSYKISMSNNSSNPAVSYICILAKPDQAEAKVCAIYTDKKSVKVGEQLAITLDANQGTKNLYYYVMSNGRKNPPIQLTNYQTKTFIERINHADRGGLHIESFSFLHNRFYRDSRSIDVPYHTRPLSFKWSTLRSDLLPGSKEKWSLTIKDYQNKGIEAELLTSMYDASLDALYPHNWKSFRQSMYFTHGQTAGHGYRANFSQHTGKRSHRNVKSLPWQYPSFIFNNSHLGYHGGRFRSRSYSVDGIQVQSAPMMSKSSDDAGMEMMEEAEMANVQADESNNKKEYGAADKSKTEGKPTKPLAVRKNLNETVFFYPALRTNAAGETIIEFTMNEALTKWNLFSFAHTKDAKFGMDKQEIVTKKDLMVFPNGPRFFRAGDKINIATKVKNLTSTPMTTQTSLHIYDARSGKDISHLFIQDEHAKEQTVPAEGSSQVSWILKVPNDVEAIRYQVISESATHQDGEEKTALVLPNRTLVRETKAIQLAPNETTKVLFDRMNNMKDATVDPKLYHISVTSNPSWLAIQSLPYLVERKTKCVEQVFARYFANSIAFQIVQDNPIIKTVYKEWKSADALKSALSKNQELKSALLEQTPWVLDALSEEEQMERMAHLFDETRILADLKRDRSYIEKAQTNGGIPWFVGGRPNHYITQYIMQGIGQMRQMGIKTIDFSPQFIQSALAYMEREILDKERRFPTKEHISPLQIHYLYTLSFYSNYSKSGPLMRLISKYDKLAKKTWLDHSILSQAQFALYCHRSNQKEWADKIMESLKQRSIFKADLGRYWKSTNGYHWYQSGIEAQAAMIRAFSEITDDKKLIDELRLWLLNNKQTNSWKSSKASTQAIMALMYTGSNWHSTTKIVRVKIANKTVDIPKDKITAATGQYDIKYTGNELNQDMAHIEFDNPNKHVAWAGVHYHYMEDMDKVTQYQETPLKVQRAFFKRVQTPNGKELVPIATGTSIKQGDEIVVKLSVDVDRPMQFIHVKDHRASGTEPRSVLSSHKYQGGLGYYMETRDAATNFFIEYLPRGKYSFEYALFAAQSGNFSAGMTTIQSMYAPEYGAHSEGFKVTIED